MTLADRLAYSPQEVAEMLGLPERSIRDLCMRGKIKAQKAGTRWLISRGEVSRLCGEDAQLGREPQEADRIADVRRQLAELREEFDQRIGQLLRDLP